MIRRNEWKGILWVLPSLIGVTVFYFFPYVDVIRRSVTENAKADFAGIKNFRTVLNNDAFLLAAQNSLRFAAICIPILLAVSLVLAVLLIRCRYGEVYKWALLLPMALPAVSVALIWKIFFHAHGMVNGLLMALGLQITDWLNERTAFWILILSYLWKNIGYNVILWMEGLRQIENSIYEAARVDGAGEIRIFFQMILPNMKRVFYTVSVLAVLNSFKVFREAYLVAGNYPHESMYLMQHLFNNWFAALSLDKMSAASVLLSFIILILVFVLYRVWGKELI